jgi:hypothetical protein
VPSPHVPGTEPSPDFRYVVLRALDDSCVRPVPPVGAPPKGGTTTPPPVDRVKPVVSRASLTNTTFRRSAASTAISAAARKRARLGTTLRFTLSETSTVTVRFEQRTTGRKVGRTCRKATRKLRRRKACTRSVKRGMLTRKALKAGANRIAFTGRLGRKALPLGRYRATVVATDAAGNRSTPKLLAFRIVRR